MQRENCYISRTKKFLESIFSYVLAYFIILIKRNSDSTDLRIFIFCCVGYIYSDGVISGKCRKDIGIFINFTQLTAYLFQNSFFVLFFQILVGYNVSTWLMMHAAGERAHRIHSVVGITSSPELAHGSGNALTDEVLIK